MSPNNLFHRRHTSELLLCSLELLLVKILRLNSYCLTLGYIYHKMTGKVKL